jgi:hypothetical protein
MIIRESLSAFPIRLCWSPRPELSVQSQEKVRLLKSVHEEVRDGDGRTPGEGVECS